ncbi:hypothetical protein [Candidatus Laterigemmans baculatus]|uniref:hypothetical protein n=1 Tax=Candidatus Laterigemmans baculatus TaxID=2770505 RepID=UPI0013DCB286|nr:hypothetical protein [Candidatus Laterigemmans baculatus]
MNPWGPLGVLRFELRRSLSAGRLALWLLVALFPMALILLTQLRAAQTMSPGYSQEAMIALLFLLIVRVASVLGLLLWATPAVQSEIEARTWLYVATRPQGPGSLVLGKYAVAILWSFTSAVAATTLAVPVAELEHGLRTWGVLTALAFLAVLAYGALFTFIGTLIQRRAMVVAILYIVLVEGALSLIPATINRFTVGFRLLSLLVQWMELDLSERSEQYQMLFTDAHPLTHLLILLLYSGGLLTAAMFRARRGGYQIEPED